MDLYVLDLAAPTMLWRRLKTFGDLPWTGLSDTSFTHLNAVYVAGGVFICRWVCLPELKGSLCCACRRYGAWVLMLMGICYLVVFIRSQPSDGDDVQKCCTF